jgi:hypothetical protein
MKYLLAPLLLLAAACNRTEQPEPPTPAETERLDEAEAMLNELGKEEGAAPQGTAPSNSTNLMEAGAE